MRLVHDEHQVFQSGQVIEIALADVFRQALDAWGFAAPHLGVDLGDIEDVHLAPDQLVEESAGSGFVVVAGDDLRRVGGKLGNALEHVFGRVRGEVGDELVVDRQIRRQHEEVVQAVRQVQVADEGAHQAGLAHTSGEGEAERRKLALEFGHRGELAANGGQRGSQVSALSRRNDLGDAVENLQGPPLRGPQAQPSGDGVDLAVHVFPPGWGAGSMP